MSIEVQSENRCFDGIQRTYSHQSSTIGLPMRFSVFTPAAAESRDCATVFYLSGLTCTEENFTVKAGAQRFAAEHNMIVVAPDTSPRGANVAGEDDSYDFGTGAGFYVDATEAPWSANYQMYSYISDELVALVLDNFKADKNRLGIFGHSMGGHGAITIGLKHPDVFRSISAFSPICNPSECDWGKKALGGYLGTNTDSWAEYDATRLVQAGKTSSKILIDQGGSDEFLEKQLLPENFKAACAKAGQKLELRYQDGYDHSYFFIASFIHDHIAFHATNLS